MSEIERISPQTFSLDSNIGDLSVGATVELDGTTDADVLIAIATGKAFPDREVELGRASLTADAGIEFTPGKGKVSFAAEGGVAAQLAVFNSGRRLLDALAVEDAGEIGLEFSTTETERLILLRGMYSVKGSVEGSHPIGAVGAVTFGVEGSRSAQYAVVRAFDRSEAAREVVAGTVKSWKLPRHVGGAEDLPPRTWIVAEVDGSVAAQLGVQVGQDFSFLREVGTGDLKGDIGLKIAARLKATIGFNAAGRYLLVVDREAGDAAATIVRCRLFKLSKKGWRFGLDLRATAQGIAEPLPENVEDLVKAVLGLHSSQLLEDLKRLREWTDPDADTSGLVAGVTVGRVIDLIEHATGINGRLAEAREALLAALDTWDGLPARVASVLSTFLEKAGLDKAERKELLATLKKLADPKRTRQELERLIADVRFGELPIGRLLSAAAEGGLLSLFDDLDRVATMAGRLHAVLSGGIVERLHQFLDEKLRIHDIKKVATLADFQTLEPILVERLSAFLDRELGFEQIDELKAAIARAEEVIQASYARMREIVTRKYEFEFASAYQKTTTRTALVDVRFDTSKAPAQALLQALLRDANLDTLFVAAADGVRLEKGVLTHEISRQSDVRINFPFYQSQHDSLRTSLARVTAGTDGDRVLFYELESSDTRRRRNRFRSQLALQAAFAVTPGPGLRIHAQDPGTMSYTYRHAQRNMTGADLRKLLEPFVSQHLPAHFTGPKTATFETWLADFDRRVEDAVGNGANEFGDVLLSLELRAPASGIGAWIRRRSGAELDAACRAVSLRLQSSLKFFVAFSYLRDLDSLFQNARTAAVLAYASIPPCTRATVAGGQVRFLQNDGLFWNWPDLSLRKAVVRSPETQTQMLTLMAQAHERLASAGESSRARFFSPGERGDFLSLATGSDNPFLHSLLFVEAEVIEGAAKALKSIAEALEGAGTKPAATIEALAEFGDAITGAFHDRLSFVATPSTMRSLGTLAFLEAAAALEPGSPVSAPAALLSLSVVREDAEFPQQAFLDGDLPSPRVVAVGQRLVGGSFTG